ncbi:MtrB/PioB family decaheme-associated outer membrane protein [Shewanella fidelis]|uniref:MtrB/PioB family decaheme-associated outer membrane protein n=1 Tax=Shewanella fidelis TaxID=173509 RepID=A0AAW8NN27_9GAMM|nr:MtrB/PioB family decaheme-associated outer membrane protein [Shewanella fidelis]MDR8523219.1 MtrB/PioB family decaheme-associated outer membrane protein [Shewanella fidelis]MDW4811455.1 MtrB/PioB family decaheme-associated outer membrane protein [Shewanella fidelis]MDW4815576.1 MtrB/PioB family decaheme-associated outer membrane protein [Shewanella fidelis]MDW4819666.1 MtrB/PioB family decaheme-associated outer membrane protein [Shewanella fidelis]MDW4824360.1 MtrB/PioB family decaheme-asso
MFRFNSQFNSKRSLLALAISAAISPVYADGYGLQNANREKANTEKWECKRCVVETGFNGTISINAAYNDADDIHFGNTTGTDKDGLVAGVDADLINKSKSGYQTTLVADKLGYDAGSARLETGRVGQYKIGLGYRGLAHYDTNSALSPYSNAGDSLTLPANWQTGAVTAQMPTLFDDAKQVALSTQRDRFLVDANYTGGFYQADISYQHEKRQGKRSFSGNFLTNSAMLAQPIDDNTDEFNAKLYFNGPGWLIGIDSSFSQYNNDHDSLIWQNAFTPTFGAAYTGQSAVAPDNKAYRIGTNAQISGNGHQVLMHLGMASFTQDDAFLPATINGPSPALPTTNLDGKVDTTDMRLKYTSRPLRQLAIRASYDYSDRDNKTAINPFPQVVTDSYYAGTAMNPEYDRTRQQAKIGAKYRFSRAIYLDTEYQYDHNDYSDLDRDRLRENGLSAKVNYKISSAWSAWLKAEFSDRTGSTYDPVSSTNSQSNPYLRKSYLADREREQYQVNVSYNTNSAFSASANVRASSDNYDQTLVGLTQVDTQGYDISASYLLNDDFIINAYLNQDWRDSDQAGSSNFSLPNWYVNTDEESTLVGAGIDYRNLMDKKLDLGLDYSYSDGQSDTELTQGISSPYGDYFAKRHNISAFAKYQLGEKIALRFDWIFEDYKDSDWLNQSLTLDAIPNVLIFGDLSHDYSAHYVGFTFSYEL